MTTRTPPPVGSHAWLRSFRSLYPWRQLSERVRREEPTCWLRLPGCTHLSTTADHVIPASVRPELALIRSNVHGACHNCNSRRSDKHPHHPDLHRPTPPPTTAAALRKIAAKRRPAQALQFFGTTHPSRKFAKS